MATLAHEGLEPTEALLWKAYVADRSARPRERLFDFYLPFARLVAARHFRRRRGGDIEFAEFCQSAYAGLLEAIDHFDPDRGVPFKGYAHGRISGSITDAVQRSSRHKSGLALRFPRVSRIRWDKPAGEADHLEVVERLVN